MNGSGHQAYTNNAVETASPEQLTLMCYDGALRFIRRAVMACEKGDLARMSEATGRAQAVINELNVTLNMDDGGEIAENLRNIYLFVNRHLAEGVMRQDQEAFNRCIGLVQDLRDAWVQAMNINEAVA